MHLCMYLWMYVHMYGCMYECMYVCMNECMYGCMYGCMYECMVVCVCMYMHVWLFMKKQGPGIGNTQTHLFTSYMKFPHVHERIPFLRFQNTRETDAHWEHENVLPWTAFTNEQKRDEKRDEWSIEVQSSERIDNEKFM